MGEGQPGFCFIRQHRDGKLVQLGYGRSTGFAVDPVEKKPLNHFFPGTPILSFGTAGCNLGCKFCQNWDISKAKLDAEGLRTNTPDDVVALALRNDCPSIAYTYNDPVIWAEYALDIAKVAHARGLKTVAVTAGYISQEARGEFYEHMDAANVDLKAFTDDFYHKVTFSHLGPVLETLKWIKRETKVWLEITNLMIPGLNDAESETKQLAEWIGAELGDEVPLHFTAFHPDFKMRDIPRTPPSTLTRARQLARDVGLKYVYTGNVHDRDGGTTCCPRCAAPVIERDWYAIRPVGLRVGAGGVGSCRACGARIAGHFDLPVRASDGRRRGLGLVYGGD